MRKAIVKKLRKFFRTRTWNRLVAADPIVIQRGEPVTNGAVTLYTTITLTLYIEGRFNDWARKVMDSYKL